MVATKTPGNDTAPSVSRSHFDQKCSFHSNHKVSFPCDASSMRVCFVDDVLFDTSIAAASERLPPIVVPEACSSTLFDTVALQLQVRVFLSTPWFLRVVVAFGGRQQCAQHIMFLNGPSVASFFLLLASSQCGSNCLLVQVEMATWSSLSCCAHASSLPCDRRIMSDGCGGLHM